MKLPYRVGDSFALPLGDGRTANARIVGHAHHLVEIAIAGPDERDAFRLRTTDRALVLQRWRKTGHGDAAVDPSLPRAERIVGPALAERLAAERFGILAATDARVRVRALHAHDDAAAVLTELPDDACVTLLDRLEPRALAQLCAWFADRPRATLRLDDGAAAHLAEIAAWPLARLALAGNCVLEGIVAPAVRRLDVQAPLTTTAIARAFPSLRALRIGALRAEVDIAALAACGALELLDCSHVRLRNADAVPACTQLRALRLAHTSSPPNAATIARLPLRALALEAQSTLGDLAPLARIASLEQLELRELWQYDIEDVAFVHAMPALLRAEIDIGGRRKNVELYRRAAWAYPWPVRVLD